MAGQNEVRRLIGKLRRDHEIGTHRKRLLDVVRKSAALSASSLSLNQMAVELERLRAKVGRPGE